MKIQETTIDGFAGKTIARIEKTKDFDGHDRIIFTMESGEKYLMGHQQECCEGVSIEDICGDLEDLVGSPLLVASAVSKLETEVGGNDCQEEWTFYNFSTIKGSVTLRWFGESTGYYSTGVDIVKIEDWNDYLIQ